MSLQEKEAYDLAKCKLAEYLQDSAVCSMDEYVQHGTTSTLQALPFCGAYQLCHGRKAAHPCKL